jgi:hypothetical protein
VISCSSRATARRLVDGHSLRAELRAQNRFVGLRGPLVSLQSLPSRAGPAVPSIKLEEREPELIGECPTRRTPRGQRLCQQQVLHPREDGRPRAYDAARRSAYIAPSSEAYVSPALEGLGAPGKPSAPMHRTMSKRGLRTGPPNDRIRRPRTRPRTCGRCRHSSGGGAEVVTTQAREPTWKPNVAHRPNGSTCRRRSHTNVAPRFPHTLQARCSTRASGAVDPRIRRSEPGIRLRRRACSRQ